MKKFLIVLVVVLMFAASFLLVRLAIDYNADSINQSKWQSRAALSYLRGKIKQYHEATGEFPSSLSEMEVYIVGKTGERWGPNKEFLSSDHGDGRESTVLDGKGGWYYNRETGEMRINLTGPLKDYLKHYYRLDRNERPCDW